MLVFNLHSLRLMKHSLKELLPILVVLLLASGVYAQEDSTASKLSFQGDFRFRVEQDWDSRKSDGTYRDDRSRLRYRLRYGFDYQYKSWASVGARIRTGDPRKQQDPQLTLGDAFNEFGTLPIALEKAFFQANTSGLTVWMGKNTFPFKKQNELFWSDNVFPEGLHARQSFAPKPEWFNQLAFSAGHFILNARGGSFDQDSYFQGLQIESQFFDERLELWPSLYLFRNIQNIPDGAETFFLDYSILGISSGIVLLKSPLIKAEIDWYQNLEDYQQVDSIARPFRDQQQGLVLALSYGQLDNKGDWFFKFTYAYLERYANVDFMAQNDWARWDYSAFDSPDGRLSNLEGIEVVAGMQVAERISIRSKYYFVEQLKPLGLFTENGQRIRFDIDIKF